MPESEPKVTVTEEAARKILEIRAKGAIPSEKVLRLCVHGGGCAGFSYGLYFDDPKPDIDRRFSLHGVEIAVDEMSLTYLAGTRLGWEEGLLESGFTFENPNVTATCGCGSSFSA